MRYNHLSHETSLENTLLKAVFSKLLPAERSTKQGRKKRGQAHCLGDLGTVLGHLHGASCLHAKQLA